MKEYFINCPQCNAIRKCSASSYCQVKKGRQKGYCKKCIIWRLKNIGNSGQWKKGHIPWSKSQKGIHLSIETEFKKGQVSKENHPNWKGGRYKNKDGYVLIRFPEHHRASVGYNYVFEHILVAEEKIGRELLKGEYVHHINHIKDDNRQENLMILTKSEHSKIHYKEMKINKKGQFA